MPRAISQSLRRSSGEALKRALEIAFGIDQEVGRRDDGFAVGDAFTDFHVTGASMAKLYGARLEPAFTSIDDDKLAVPAVNHGAVRHAYDRLSASRVDFGLC